MFSSFAFYEIVSSVSEASFPVTVVSIFAELFLVLKSIEKSDDTKQLDELEEKVLRKNNTEIVFIG